MGGSFQALDRLADTLCDEHAIGRLTEVCGRWVYSSCLCFALDINEQRRLHFHYRYSAYQIEYSRNLLFTRGTTLDAVFQGLIDRTRRYLDVPKLRTIFGYKTRPHHRQGKKPLRMARVLDQPTYELKVFKVHFGPLTLRLYDKGARVLRVEAIANNVKRLRCGKSVEKPPIMLAELQRTCAVCGGALRIIACIEDPAVINKIITHIDSKNASAEPARLPPCRAPPQARWF